MHLYCFYCGHLLSTSSCDLIRGFHILRGKFSSPCKLRSMVYTCTRKVSWDKLWGFINIYKYQYSLNVTTVGFSQTDLIGRNILDLLICCLVNIVCFHFSGVFWYLSSIHFKGNYCNFNFITYSFTPVSYRGQRSILCKHKHFHREHIYNIPNLQNDLQNCAQLISRIVQLWPWYRWVVKRQLSAKLLIWFNSNNSLRLKEVDPASVHQPNKSKDESKNENGFVSQNDFLLEGGFEGGMIPTC